MGELATGFKWKEAVAGEILVHMIRENSDIKGYDLAGIEVKTSQYDDDTRILPDGSKKSFDKCIETLVEFSKYSGPRLTKRKQISCGLAVLDPRKRYRQRNSVLNGILRCSLYWELTSLFI